MGWRDQIVESSDAKPSGWRSQIVESAPASTATSHKKHTTWDPRDLERSQHAQNAVAAASGLVDDEANADKDAAAHAALGAADTLGFGLADEARGVGAMAAAPWRGRDPVDEYKRARDEQRDASRMAQDQNPEAYGAGQLGATALSALLPGGAAGSGASTLGGAVARGAGTGAAIGAVGGFGGGEGAADSLMQAGTGAVLGGALGGAGGAIASGAPRAAAAAGRGLSKGATALEALLSKATSTADANPLLRGGVGFATAGKSEAALAGARLLAKMLKGGPKEHVLPARGPRVSADDLAGYVDAQPPEVAGPVADHEQIAAAKFNRDVQPDPFGGDLGPQTSPGLASSSPPPMVTSPDGLRAAATGFTPAGAAPYPLAADALPLPPELQYPQAPTLTTPPEAIRPSASPDVGTIGGRRGPPTSHAVFTEPMADPRMAGINDALRASPPAMNAADLAASKARLVPELANQVADGDLAPRQAIRMSRDAARSSAAAQMSTTEKQAEAWRLYHRENMPPEEIAKRLKIKGGARAVRLMTASSHEP